MLLFILLSTVAAKITNCGNTRALFKLNAAGFWPDPAIRNGNSTVSLDYTVPDGLTVAGGTVTYSVIYNSIPLTPSTDPLCSQAVICPIKPGTYNTSSSTTFPDVSGGLNIKAEWKDDANNLLLCYSINTRTG